jgi:hypothetical protein
LASPRVTRKRLWLILGGVALLVLAAFLVGPSLLGPADRTSSGTSPSDGTGASVPDISGQSVAATSVPETWTIAAGSVPSGGSVIQDSAEEVGTFHLRVFWWNDTRQRAMKGAVVTWGKSGSWTPDVSRPSQAATIGPFPTGKALKLTVYPDGRTRSANAVSFTLTPAMLSGSDRDGIHIEVRDDGVRVLGNPVHNFEVDFSRP